MKTKPKAAARLFSSLPRTINLIYRAAPAWTAGWFVFLVLQGLLPVATVYLSRAFVDSLVATMNGQGDRVSLQHTLTLGALIAGTMLMGEILRGLMDWVRTAQSELIQDHVRSLIHAQAVRVDLAFYESADYHNRLFRVSSEASNRPMALLESLGSLLQNSLTLAGIGLMLLSYGVWLPAALLASTLPALVVVLRSNRQVHQWWEETTADRRWVQYFDAMLTHSSAAAELRLFNLGPHFRDAYTGLRRRLRSQRLDLQQRQSLSRVGAGLLALAAAGASLLWLLWQATLGRLTLGDLALFYQAFSKGQALLQTLLNNLGQIHTNSLFLGNLYEFIALEPEVVDQPGALPAPRSVTRGIHFRDIHFYYPGSEQPALQDFNLHIPAGQVTAIVGANGAGKSTLVKLLCRFYEPSAGSIEVDGTDLRQISLAGLRQMITVLFQFPVPYHATAANNIALGSLEAKPARREVEEAARSAGAQTVIERLPERYDTLLGKLFANGMELSAGEWQRIALARAYLRRAPLIVLDEPTSFMDSWAEAEWFERFQELAAGRTAVLITHRFSIAMRADTIHVMQAGQVVESGSHHELLAQGGEYARSWSAQMQAPAPLMV